MKTATINVHHVFGTKNTVYCGAYYRGKRIKYFMENGTAQELLTKLREWLSANKPEYTHHRINYG